MIRFSHSCNCTGTTVEFVRSFIGIGIVGDTISCTARLVRRNVRRVAVNDTIICPVVVADIVLCTAELFRPIVNDTIDCTAELARHVDVGIGGVGIGMAELVRWSNIVTI